ncbi:hypothetical protein GF319_15290 [Candidatus Bathyarchaeota archaeon]|jgi:hypothetical protein|nr:hypothetical protein [Candidatus Bathyarchaeota archaeon]
MSTSKVDRMIKTLSTGLSRTEAQKLQDSLKIRGVREKFEDPLTARKIMEKFQLPVFRRDYFEDPLTAISKIDRYSTDPQPDIPRRK